MLHHSGFDASGKFTQALIKSELRGRCRTRGKSCSRCYRHFTLTRGILSAPGRELPAPDKRANRPFEVLELDLSGFPTNQELTQIS